MSQSYEACLQELFCVCCKDVGLDCNCTIYGINEETAIYNTILHMFEYHAIEPNEMGTGMGLKIMENVHVHHSPPPRSKLVYNNQS
jgi:predicted small metal-binding protein